MRKIEDLPGLKVGGKLISNLRCPNNTVLMAENDKDLQNLQRGVNNESREKGLDLNKQENRSDGNW